MFNERYKLHPISAVINFFKGLKELIIPIIVIFFANGLQGDDWFSLIPYAFVLLFFIISIVSGYIKWKRFVYWFEDDELRIEYGLFVKKKRYIPFDRIQSLDYTESILHRPFKLVRVKIETAGSGASKEAEAVLTAVTREAANRVEQEIALAKKRKLTITEDIELTDTDYTEEIVEEKSSEKIIYKMSIKELLIHATTSSGIGVILSGLGVAFSQFSEYIPYESIYNEFLDFVEFGVLIIALVSFSIVLVGWVFSVALSLLNYYQYTLVKEDDQVIITRGLLEKKKITIPLHRVQAVRIIENPFRQLLGFVSVTVDSAGGAVGSDQKINFLPIVHKSRVKELLSTIFTDQHFDVNFEKVPKRSKHFYYRLNFIWMVPVIAVITYFLFPFGLLSLFIIPLVIFYGLWQYRAAGFSILGDEVSFRFRLFSRHTFYMKKKRIQSMTVKQNIFQKRKGIATVEATVKSGLLGATAGVVHINEEDAHRLLNWYKPNEKQMNEKGQRE